jgi:hypothetical protein
VAVTVKLNCVPAVTGEGADTWKEFGLGFTVKLADGVDVTPVFVVSLATRLYVPVCVNMLAGRLNETAPLLPVVCVLVCVELSGKVTVKVIESVDGTAFPLESSICTLTVSPLVPKVKLL